MISENSVAIRFEPAKKKRGKCRVRAVFVEAVKDLGPLGKFALIRSGLHDTRQMQSRFEADAVAVDVRELLPLSWLENISSGLVCVPLQKKASRWA